ncbi:Serpentine Receptor, class U [Caenorhabditis elegans]|uniref:Serpentine Receptor, class U n=1 Tax=Caenorhabditis elegans TaxID=6239 RepID=A0A0K3ASF7_CAEEL|nr:Serpentine Receptor, class U [Caenorhabditis elegans]CTQ86789.1 Serpentine Receptor, class U [Caenorhabditis elegans]|eukprot:NP_001300090.1 Serpentine Receptor, class U [Caenorhabditis elegans]
MSAPSLITFSIHGNIAYINYQFSFFTLPVLLLFVPVLYIPATCVIVFRICSTLLIEYKNKNVNIQLFGVITLSHVMCLLFFTTELFYLRLPMAGVFTSWCASVLPNGYLISLVIMTYYFNYATMAFPFLVALLRLNLIIFPSTHAKVNKGILKIAIPLIFTYPFIFTFFLFPGSGFCTKIEFLPFGSIILRVTDTLFGINNTIPLIFTTFFWFSACLITNFVLIFKLIRHRFTVDLSMRSQKSHKAEISLTLTTISGIFFPSVAVYLIVIRPFTNDLDTCIVPWVFYLTHPIFQEKPKNRIIVSSVERIHN